MSDSMSGLSVALQNLVKEFRKADKSTDSDIETAFANVPVNEADGPTQSDLDARKSQAKTDAKKRAETYAKAIEAYIDDRLDD